MNEQVFHLPCGARFAALEIPTACSVSVAVWVEAGSRHESSSDHGLAHFLEHLLFKGSRKRSSRQISNSIEGLGGDINGQTSTDYACFYVTAPAGNAQKAADVLLDMFVNPKLDPGDIELERAVIAEEIAMYQDEPADHVNEILSAMCWPRHPLGRSILGTPQSLATINREKLLSFRQNFYSPQRVLLAAAGAFRPSSLAELAQNHLRHLPPPPNPPPPPPPKAPSFPKKAALRWLQKPVSQTHLALAMPGVSHTSPHRHALNLLAIILGGNSGSRLFQQIREKRGWCYSVSADIESFHDSGILHVSLGLDAQNLKRALQLLASLCDDLRQGGCSPKELQRAKQFCIGSAKIALERSSTHCLRLAHSLLKFGRPISFQEWEQSILEVTLEDVTRAAQTYLQTTRSQIAVISPEKHNPDVLNALLNH